MPRSLLPGGLRGRLIAAIIAVAAIVMAGSFIALHEGTGADLRSEIDSHLRADFEEFALSPAGGATNEAEFEKAARSFITSQGYHADSRIFAIQLGASGRTVITNERKALSSERAEGGESADGDIAASGILRAPQGLATITAPDGGRLRVLTEPAGPASDPLGMFHVAQSLGPVGAAQGSLRDTLLVVGAVALVVLIAAALWIATLVARPLSRIAGFAAEIDTADLDRRLDEREGPAEVRSLAHSFNHMLDRLQRSFERERDFVADASHELRTPVTIAQGELDLLRRELPPAEGERLDVVRRELKRMERLVAEMLTLASQDVESALVHQRIDVADILFDLRRDLPLMGARNYEVDDVGGTVIADPDRLAQVFRNLLGNAVAHTESGGRIHVSAVPDGERIRFEVEDDGPGFGEGEAEHLFDRFFRTDAGRARDDSGSGLGLAIARSIVEAHGGRIWAVPTTGAGGATVAFELPGYRASAGS